MSKISNTENMMVPDNAPAVSFDIKLGKKYDHVDFDYEEFALEAQRLGIAPEDYAELSIRVGENRWWRAWQGYYDLDDMAISLFATKRRNINTCLSHELSHFSDHVSDRISAEATVRGLLSDASLVFERYIPPTAALIGVAGLISKNRKLAYGSAMVGAAAKGVGTISSKYLYEDDPEEARAIEAERLSSHKSINLEKKPNFINRAARYQ